jgi:hypothetical protein
MKQKNLLIFILLLFTSSVFAVNSQLEKAVDLYSPEQVSKYSVAKWKKIADKAKHDFYDEFNRLNREKKYYVVCEVKSTLGTAIKRRICEPRYFKQGMYEQTQIQGISAGGSPTLNFFPNRDSVLWFTKGMEEGADENLIELLDKHPDLRAKYVEYVRAAEAYNYKRSLNY